jgi:hypothetical protein
MDKGSIFFAFIAIWYLNRYGISSNLLLLLSNLYHQVTHLRNVPVIGGSTSNGAEVSRVDEPTIEIKYEDKYLAEIRQLEKEFKFDENDETMVKKTSECLRVITDSFMNRRMEIGLRLRNIALETEKYNENKDEFDQETIQQTVQLLTEERDGLLEEDDALKNSMETDEGIQQNNKQATEDARQFMIDGKLDKLKNCHVIEHTPSGNVLMIYDKVRETFKYYSDNTIPYRYLDVVARKYVKFFNCRPIFVNTEEEIQLAEKKMEQAKKDREEKEAVEKKRKEEAVAAHKPAEEKKRVFAKFKSYNKEAGTGHVSTGAPPKNSGPTRQPAEKSDNDAVLKERANRYTYEGKMANFSFIQKIDRKVVDKKLAMTFAEFKKMGLAKK